MAGQTIALGTVVWSVRHEGVNPRVLSLAFILMALARLITVQIMIRLSRHGSTHRVETLQSRLFRPPPAGKRPPYYTYGDSGVPVGFVAHLLILGAVFGVVFVFLHLDARGELRLSWDELGSEMAWAIVIAFVYWLCDLFTRDIVFDMERPAVDNLAFNNTSLTLLAVAVLLSAGLIVGAQARGTAPSPWLFYGTLLGLVHLTELWRGWRAPQGETNARQGKTART